MVLINLNKDPLTIIEQDFAGLFSGEVGVSSIAGKAMKDSAVRTNPRVASLAEVLALTLTAITKAR